MSILAVSQVEQALAYNRSKYTDADEIRLIQERTGSTPDGAWGSRTVRALAAWQAAQGLGVDGKVGTVTWAALVTYDPLDECPSTPPARDSKPIKIGVWGDDYPRMMARADYAAELRDLGVTEIALMMNRANVSHDAEPWDLRWTDRGAVGWRDDEIAEVADAMRHEGIDVVLTTWPRPEREQIDTMCADMLALLTVTHASGWEVDVEGNWVLRYRRGFSALDAAAEYLVTNMRSTLDAAGLLHAKTEATTFGHHAELGQFPTVTPRVDRVVGQGYSVSPRASGIVDPASYLGPGHHQRWIHARMVKVKAREIVMGLAAYKQSGFRGLSPEVALRLAYDAAADLGVRHVRYWSSKWIVGSQRTSYAAAFLRAIS